MLRSRSVPRSVTSYHSISSSNRLLACDIASRPLESRHQSQGGGHPSEGEPSGDFGSLFAAQDGDCHEMWLASWLPEKGRSLDAESKVVARRDKKWPDRKRRTHQR